MRIHNIYYLIGAFMMIISVFAHPYYGEQMLFPYLDATNIEAMVKQNLFMGWNLPTSTSFICAIGLVAVSLIKDRQQVRLAVLLILGINIGRYCVVIFTGWIKGPEIFQELLTQSIYMFAFCMLLVFGLKKDRKQFHVNSLKNK